MANAPAPRQRHWANVAVILTSVVLLAMAIWGGSGAAPVDTGETRRAPVVLFSHFFGAALALTGVFAAQRWRFRRAGQLALWGAAAALLVAMVMLRYVGPLGWLTLILPAAVLIGASFFLGPMPRPEEESRAARERTASRPRT